METETSRSQSGSDGAAREGGTGTRRKLSDEQEREVTRLYSETETPVSEISKGFAIGESSVDRVTQRHGGKLRGRTPTGGAEDGAEAAPKAAVAGRGRRGRAAAAAPAAAAGAGATPTPAGEPGGNGRRRGRRPAAAAA